MNPSSITKSTRLECLRRYQVLDASLDASFEEIAALATVLCQTPIAQIVFTDSENFWRKSIMGLESSEQHLGCCSHTLLEDGFFEVPDTLKDKHFSTESWVISDPKIRHYAGVPLTTQEGITIGILSVMDREARFLNAAQRAGLHRLAGLIMSILSVRDRLEPLKKEDRKYEELDIVLKRTLSLLDATMAATTDGILVVDHHGKVVRFNQHFVMMWGIKESVSTEGHEKMILGVLEQLKEPERFLEKMTQLYETPEEVTYDVFELKNGKVFERYSQPQWVEGKHVGRVWSFRDTTERHEQAALLGHRALHDGLTNLPNRVLLLDRLQQAILLGRREMKSFAVLLMDLDRFKEVNDTLGHRIGDILLRQVSSRITTILRKSDTLARLGGDEFAILLMGQVTAEDAIQFAEKVHQVLEPSFLIEDVSLDIDVSIGISLFPDHGDQVHSLLKMADIAMYMAKSAETGIMVYNASKDRYSLKGLVLKNDLRQAIQNEQLFLLYQPKVNLKTNQVMGVEALVRWKHPQFGTIPPDEFIALAEQTGLIKPLTIWVLKQALNQELLWRKAGLDLRVAVNLSVRSLRDSKLSDQILEVLQSLGTAADRLELEITESIIMDDPTRAMEIVTRLSSEGIKFALDDFGTGYSSLSYLKKLPISAVKIDKSFILDMMAEGDDEIIVVSIIELAHNLGMKVIAEGLEDQETMDRLSALSCDEVQGYFLSRPIPGAEILQWAEKWTTTHPL